MSRGALTALAAYVMWGLSPIFWRLGEAAADSLLTFRVVATLVVVGLIQIGRDRGRNVRTAVADRRVVGAMAVSAALVSSNWLIYIWSVTNERVLEASLGYFLNPLISVVLGVTVLRERLRPVQWIAIAVVAGGVIVLSVDLGRVPWIAIALAVTFGLYGLIRKTAPVGSLDGLTIEVSLLLPFALVALGALTAAGEGAAEVSAPWGWVWVMGAGLMTAVPLVLFASAARRIELWMIGVLQYVVPTLQFLLGVLAYDEPWAGGQVVGYVVIWFGLAVFAGEGIVNAQRVRSRGDRVLGLGR